MTSLGFRFFSHSCIYAVIVSASLILAGCGPKPVAETEKDKAAALQGINLTLLVVDDEPLVKAISLLRGQWQAETGSELTVSGITAEALIDSVSQGELSGDAVVYAPQLLGTMAESRTIRSLKPDVLREPDLDWPDLFELLKTREVVWGSDVFAVPLGSPMLLCFYDEARLQSLNLQPPTTWTEYAQVASALAASRRTVGKDEVPAENQDAATPEEWQSVVEPWGPGWAGVTLLARAAAYARHGNHYSTLFNMQSMEPLIASPPFVRALDELLATARLASPDARKLSLADVWQRMATGRAALALCWPAQRSNADNRAATAELPELNCVEVPGSAEAYNPTAGQWDRRGAGVTSVPLVGAAGRVGSILSKSAQPDGARRLLSWLASRQWSERTLVASEESAPFRASQITSAQSWMPELPAQQAQQYARTLAASLTAADCLVVLRIPGTDRYLAALDEGVRRAIAGQGTSEEVLQAVAEKWRAITAELGIDRQRDAYQRSLGL